MKQPRSVSRAVPCPACGAEAGEACIRLRGGWRESCHLERCLLAVGQK